MSKLIQTPPDEETPAANVAADDVTFGHVVIDEFANWSVFACPVENEHHGWRHNDGGFWSASFAVYRISDGCYFEGVPDGFHPAVGTRPQTDPVRWETGVYPWTTPLVQEAQVVAYGRQSWNQGLSLAFSDEVDLDILPTVLWGLGKALEYGAQAVDALVWGGDGGGWVR